MEAEIANTIETVVDRVMQEHVIPRIEQMVQSHLDDAVYRAVTHANPAVISREVRQAVRDLIANRIEVSVRVEPKENDG